MLRGIDVSAVQGVVPWDKVAAAGARFAVLKCGEGNKPSSDPQFLRNRDAARAAGVIVGAYHFPYALPGPGEHDARWQARHHYELSEGLGSRNGDLPPACDAEWPAPQDWGKWGCTAPQLRQWLLDYLDESTTLYGVRPLVYTYPDWSSHVQLSAEPRFSNYSLWSASYPHGDRWPVDGELPFVPKPWTEALFWQTSGGTFYKLPNGTPVDTDVFLGDESEMRALTYRAQEPLRVASFQDVPEAGSPGDITPG